MRRRGTAVASPARHNGRVACRDAIRSLKEEHVASIAWLVGSLRRKDDGQDLLEYALLVALIALVAVGAVTAAGVKVQAVFNAIVAALPA